MTISIQLVEVPENEQVQTRQVAFPRAGGTIGRSFDCTLVLPDFSRFLSRVHAEIVPSLKGGYEIVNKSANGLNVNAQPLTKGKSIVLFDGDVIKLGGYVLLVSDMNAALTKKTATSHPEEAVQQPPFEAVEPPFKSNLVDQDDFMSPFGQDDTAFGEPQMTEEPLVAKDDYSVENVNTDDPFGDDPFADDGMSLNESAMHAPEEDSDIPVLEVEALERESSPAPAVHSADQNMFQENLRMLTKLVEQQQPVHRDPLGREKLMACLKTTLDRFLETLTPEALEEEFNDYITGGWGSKDKKYWDMYRKRFNRKLKNGEFRRQFNAMLMEEIREKDQQND